MAPAILRKEPYLEGRIFPLASANLPADCAAIQETSFLMRRRGFFGFAAFAAAFTPFLTLFSTC